MVERLTLSGEYDLSRKAEVADLFASIASVERLELDFTKVEYVDSTILNEMARLRRRLPDCEIVILGASQNVRRLFQIVGFEEIFAWHND
jgi:anti-anti-sigma factor